MNEYENYVEKMKDLKPHKKEKEPSGLEAYEIVKEECDFAFGGTANGDRVRKNLPIIEKENRLTEEEYDLLKEVLYEKETS